MIKEESPFNPQLLKIAEFTKSLSHPARISILIHLSEQKRCICNNIVDVLPLSQATVSQHLKALKNIGLIKGNVEGNSICYCINETELKFQINELCLLLNKISKELQ